MTPPIRPNEQIKIMDTPSVSKAWSIGD